MKVLEGHLQYTIPYIKALMITRLSVCPQTVPELQPPSKGRQADRGYTAQGAELHSTNLAICRQVKQPKILN